MARKAKSRPIALSSDDGGSKNANQRSELKEHHGPFDDDSFQSESPSFPPSANLALKEDLNCFPLPTQEPTFALSFNNVSVQNRRLSLPQSQYPSKRQLTSSTTSSELFVGNSSHTSNDSNHSTIHPTSIPAQVHTSSYSCPLLQPSLANGSLIPLHFSHLPCSFLTNTHTRPPTLLELKKHTQSLCLLLSTLQSPELESQVDQDDTLPCPVGTPSFDFLDDLYTPYENEDADHNGPLSCLMNTISPLSPFDPPNPTQIQACSVSETADSTNDMAPLIAHINTNLETLDQHYDSQGGLLALLPAENSVGYKQSTDGIFGQWLHYTQNLVSRVAELERDIVSLREVLGGRSIVAKAHADGKDVEMEQDRYVLAGLSDGLWKNLNKELDVEAEKSLKTEEEANRRLRGSTHGSVDGLNLKVKAKGKGKSKHNGKVTKDRDEVITSCISIPSRLYRVKGQRTIHIIPGWDLHPGAEAVKAIENTPLVQTIVRWDPHVAPATDDVEKRERGMAQLMTENQQLKGVVEGLERREENWEKEREELEGEVADLVAEITVGRAWEDEEGGDDGEEEYVDEGGESEGDEYEDGEDSSSGIDEEV